MQGNPVGGDRGMLRIAFDLSGGREGGTGRGTYTRSLLSALAAVDRANQYYFYGYQTLRGLLERSNLRYRQYGDLNFIHVWHFPDLISPYLKRHVAADPRTSPHWRSIRVVTVHDLLFEEFPDEFPASTRHRFEEGLEAVISSGAHVISPSQCSAERLRERGVPSDRVAVVHLAAAPHFSPCEDEEALASLRRRYRLSRPYLLYVGGTYARKNLSTALRAFDLLLGRTRLDLQLVVVGVPPGEARSLAEAQGRGISDREDAILFAGIVSAGDMPLLYNAAEAVLYPSLAEGFGLPVLEAMACGTPVVTSTAPAMMEVGGEAAVFVDPREPEELAAVVARILGDVGLKNQLCELGLAQAARFSWERTARETVAVYNRYLQVSVA